MRSSLWWATLFAGSLMACGFDGASGNADGGGDNAINPATCTESSSTFATLCGLSLTRDRELSGPIDTGVDAQCTHVILEVKDSTPELCVISAATITIPDGATVRATGPRPLVLVAATTITISGTLDVSSTRATTVPVKGESLGAGADSRAGLCAADFSRGPGSGQGGGGGGAGGSLGGRGGGGADGNVDTGSAKADGGDNTSFRERTTFLRGGCRGQNGGAGRSPGGAGGIGGPPGGAVFLAAGAAVQIVGRITANGGGGLGGDAQAGGGGGGGSGGFIAIEATMVSNRGAITAKGGGGGEGGFATFPPPGPSYIGEAGEDPDQTTIEPAAGGSDDDNVGGNGGRGGSGPGSLVAVSAFNSNESGGGGGGAPGFVLVVSSTAPVEPGVEAPPFRIRAP